MKVKELINTLKKFDGEMDVYISKEPEGNEFCEVDVVQEEKMDVENLDSPDWVCYITDDEDESKDVVVIWSY